MPVQAALRSQIRSMAPVEFVDLRAQHDEVRQEIEAALAGIIDESAFIGGRHLERFERDFAEYLGAAHVIGVSSGTDAVRIALEIVGVRRDDAVVTVAHTFIGSVEGAFHLGARPLFVDVDPETRTMCPESVARFLDSECRSAGGELVHVESGRRIGAILPVHLYGQSADMAPILELAARYGVPVVEDAAQAHGTTYVFPDGRETMCGTMGDAAAFSFYPGKNLGAMGEAGAVVARTPEDEQRARLLRDHGQSEKYVHVLRDGGNARLDALQAAVLSVKLRRLGDWNARRGAAAARYHELLDELPTAAGLERACDAGRGRHAWHLYVVHHPNRDSLRERLARAGIATGLHYPIPLHRQPAFADDPCVAQALPVTERSAATCLSLPMHPHLTDEEIERVVHTLGAALVDLA